jgi:hypothetical protein
MSPAHLQQYASSGQLSESLPSSQVNFEFANTKKNEYYA